MIRTLHGITERPRQHPQIRITKLHAKADGQRNPSHYPQVVALSCTNTHFHIITIPRPFLVTQLWGSCCLSSNHPQEQQQRKGNFTESAMYKKLFIQNGRPHSLFFFCLDLRHEQTPGTIRDVNAPLDRDRFNAWLRGRTYLKSSLFVVRKNFRWGCKNWLLLFDCYKILSSCCGSSRLLPPVLCSRPCVFAGIVLLCFHSGNYGDAPSFPFSSFAVCKTVD